MNLRRLLLLTALAPAVAIGACGSSDDEFIPGTKQASWADAASERCAQYKADAVKISERYAAQDLAIDEMVDRSMRDGMPLLRDMIGDLKAIDVPDDVQEDWDRFISGWTIIADRMPDFVDEQVAGEETEEMREMFREVGNRVVAISGKYDLGECSKVSPG